MLLGLLALVPSLLVSPPAGGGDQLSRRVLLRGAAASVLTVSAAANAEDFGGEFAKQGLGFQERPSSLGSAGISAYQQLKLQTALDDLAAPAADAPSSLKPTLEVFLSQLPAVAKSIAPDTKKLISAAAALSKLAANEDLEQQAAAISKSAIALEAGIKKQDTKVAAAAAIAIANGLVDYTYAYVDKEKPMVELNREAPAVYDPSRTKIELPVSGKRI